MWAQSRLVNVEDSDTVVVVLKTHVKQTEDIINNPPTHKPMYDISINVSLSPTSFFSLREARRDNSETLSGMILGSL